MHCLSSLRCYFFRVCRCTQTHLAPRTRTDRSANINEEGRKILLLFNNYQTKKRQSSTAFSRIVYLTQSNVLAHSVEAGKLQTNTRKVRRRGRSRSRKSHNRSVIHVRGTSKILFVSAANGGKGEGEKRVIFTRDSRRTLKLDKRAIFGSFQKRRRNNQKNLIHNNNNKKTSTTTTTTGKQRRQEE